MNTTPSTYPAIRPGMITLSRSDFKNYLYGLYKCRERGVDNDATADLTIEHISHAEVLLSPEGPLIALHHQRSDTVTVIRADIVSADIVVEVAA